MNFHVVLFTLTPFLAVISVSLFQVFWNLLCPRIFSVQRINFHQSFGLMMLAFLVMLFVFSLFYMLYFVFGFERF